MLPSNSDHVVAIQLREQIATLQKKLQQKDNQLLQKDKEVGFGKGFVILEIASSSLEKKRFQKLTRKAYFRTTENRVFQLSQNKFLKSIFQSFPNLSQITEWKGKHFTIENDMRLRMKDQERVYEAKLEVLNKKIQGQLKEIAQLSKSQKRNERIALKESAKIEKETTNSSGTDSPNN